MQIVTPNNVINFRHFDYANPKHLWPKTSRAWRVAGVVSIVLFAVLIVKSFG